MIEVLGLIYNSHVAFCQQAHTVYDRIGLSDGTTVWVYWLLPTTSRTYRTDRKTLTEGGKVYKTTFKEKYAKITPHELMQLCAATTDLDTLMIRIAEICHIGKDGDGGRETDESALSLLHRLCHPFQLDSEDSVVKPPLCSDLMVKLCSSRDLVPKDRFELLYHRASLIASGLHNRHIEIATVNALMSVVDQPALSDSRDHLVVIESGGDNTIEKNVKQLQQRLHELKEGRLRIVELTELVNTLLSLYHLPAIERESLPSSILVTTTDDKTEWNGYSFRVDSVGSNLERLDKRQLNALATLLNEEKRIDLTALKQKVTERLYLLASGSAH